MRFASPEYLYYLSIPIIILLLYLFSEWKAQQKIKSYGEVRLFWSLVPHYSSIRQHIKFTLILLAISLIILTLARPQFGLIKEVERRAGIEAIITLDVSNSMLATDVSPNRLERSKQFVSNLVDRMRNDKIGLNVFAGEAYPQMPITSDFVSVKLFLDNIATGIVTLQGTNLASAITLATHSFTRNDEASRIIIIVTDGEDHEEGAIKAAEEAKKLGMKVYVLGVGTAEGSVIPTPYGPMTDREGNVVRTSVNSSFALQVAEAGGGKYLQIDNTNTALRELEAEISKLQKSASESMYSVYNEQFVAVAIIALLLLIVEIVMLDTTHPIYRRFHLFER
jgi:Ca-activated chloride channel family protein